MELVWNNPGAFAAKGQVTMAEAERRILEQTSKKTPADQEFSFYSNKTQAFPELLRTSWMPELPPRRQIRHEQSSAGRGRLRSRTNVITASRLNGFIRSESRWALLYC